MRRGVDMDRIDEAVEELVTAHETGYEEHILAVLKYRGGETRVDDPEFKHLLPEEGFWEALFDLKKRGVIEAEFPDKIPEASVIKLVK
jgi:hypothetical protein